MKRAQRTILILCLTAPLLLAGCKRGGGTARNAAPVASAGADVTAHRGDLVVLDGSGSSDPDGAALTFAWNQSAGPTVALDPASSARPSFTAPQGPATLRFALTVSDGTATATDEVVVTVANRAPVANAGPPSFTGSGWLVTLDARMSWDPDEDELVFTWFQSGGPPVATQELAPGVVRFIAPPGPASLEFTVLVSDGATTSEDSVVVTVLGPGKNPPRAEAGPDVTVPRRAEVTLYGWGSDPDYDALEVAWEQISGPGVALTGATTPVLAFTAPDEDADLAFSFSASDGFSVDTDEVVVHVRNQAPVVAELTVTPAQPHGGDDLVAHATTFDADGDAVEVTYAWEQNGAVVAGRDGATFPAALTSRGDVITVVATASDGALSTSARASVTILDAPATIAATPPETVAHGSHVSFQATANDPDGDPIGPFVLVHGPAGMTVSPSGAVSWDAKLPMFDGELAVSWAIGLEGDPDARLEGTLRVQDPARRYPLRRTGIDIPIWGSGLTVTDLDGDGTVEMLVASTRGVYELARAGSGYAQRWAYPFALGAGASAPSAVAARDVDGDGSKEIFLAAGNVVVELDGVSRRELARYTGTSTATCRDLDVADLAADGKLRVVCLGAADSYSSQASFVVLDAATLALLYTSPVLSLGSSFATGNVDGDAALEIVTAGGYVFDGKTFANEWAYGPGFGRAVDTGDLDGDGVEEIVGMADWSSVRGFSAVERSPLWEKTGFDFDALLVADIDRDGVPEILIGDGQWGNVTAYRYVANTNSLSQVFQLNSQDHGVTSIGVGDVDGDGADEIVWGSGATSSGADVLVVAGRSPAAVEWKSANPEQLYGPFVGALRARIAGAIAVLFATPGRLIAVDPASGGLTVSADLGTTGSALDAFDYDGDLTDEALLASASYYGGYVLAYDPALAKQVWTSPADLGGTRALTHADLNGDSVPDLVGITGDGYVYAFDLAHEVLLWKSTGLGSGVAVATADLDGDGQLEIVALGGARLVAYERAAEPFGYLERASVAVSGGGDLVVADCDGDGAPEIYVLASTYYSATGTVNRYDAELAPVSSFTVGASAVSMHVEDLGFARKNLVLGIGEAYAYYGSTTVSELRAVDPRTGANVWRSPPLLGTVSQRSLSYVDVDGDGVREIAFGTTSGMHVTR